MKAAMSGKGGERAQEEDVGKGDWVQVGRRINDPHLAKEGGDRSVIDLME